MGVVELIWNALDADATQVDVRFARNDLEGLEEVRVIDNGHGMSYDDAVEGFGSLGGSWKQTALVSKRDQRALHGRDGSGRFKAARLGSSLRWTTVGEDPEGSGQRKRVTISLRLTDLAHGEISEAEPTDDPTGTTVVVGGLNQPLPGLGGEVPIEKLTSTFGLYLQTYNAHLTFDREEIDPSVLQAHRADYPVPMSGGDDALLTVIEWNKRVGRSLYLCDERATPLAEQPPGIHAPGFEFTAYLQWTGFEGDPNLAAAELGYGQTKEVIESAQDQLREHFKARAADLRREVITEWKREHTYPFEDGDETPAQTAVREVFDVIAVTASSVVNASERPAQRLSLRLIREALEQDPGSLRRVLSDVLDLPQDRLDELSDLLDRTPLTSLIATSREVTNRLEFLAGLQELVLSPDVAKHVKERSQLHRILAAETWVFGDEYALGADDESLTTVLKRHIEILGRDELAEGSAPVTDLEGHTRIVDLMLARSLEQNRNRREHLVVELKAPKVAVGDDEAAQIRKYATAVAGDPRFDTADVKWDFYVISAEIKGSPAVERESDNRPFGQIMNAKGIKVWVLSWADVIEAAEHRLKFVRQHLGYQPDTQRALEYLRVKHEKLLPTALVDSGDDARDPAGPGPG